MKPNALRTNVENALAWAPNIDASRIGVAANDGAVTLSGQVPSYYARTEAERVAKRVRGVKAIANDLEIDLPGNSRYTDTEIAEAIVDTYAWHVTVPDGKIQASVQNGWVTLTGEAEWQYQKSAAEAAVRPLAGVKGVTNHVTVTPRVRPDEVKAKIEAALTRDARLEAERIRVEADGGTVTLRGTVDSFDDRDEADLAAWSAPGVTAVNDLLEVVD